MTAAGARIASLAMYALPELDAANDDLWSALAARLIDQRLDGVPERLTRDRPLDEAWTDPNLLFGQTCGYPLMTALRGRVTLLATPRYTAQGCEGPTHSSAVIVRRSAPATCLADLNGGRCAINDYASNSGMNLLRHAIAPLAAGRAFFESVQVTGSHAASADAVTRGEADVAAIDCVTWAHLQRFRAETTRHLRVLSWTASTPSLPLITSGATRPADIAALRQAIEDVARDPALRDVRAQLLLDGFSTPPAEQYQTVLDLEAVAIRQNYPVLR